MFSVIQRSIDFCSEFMFISLCEFSVVSKYDEMNYNFFLKFFTMYFEVQILVIWNNHEFGVLMNGNVKCVENQGRNNECMHVKCKYVVTIVWNNYERIKFHFYQNSLKITIFFICFAKLQNFTKKNMDCNQCFSFHFSNVASLVNILKI
jgi:hypothetical protein